MVKTLYKYNDAYQEILNEISNLGQMINHSYKNFKGQNVNHFNQAIFRLNRLNKNRKMIKHAHQENPYVKFTSKNGFFNPSFNMISNPEPKKQNKKRSKSKASTINSNDFHIDNFGLFLKEQWINCVELCKDKKSLQWDISSKYYDFDESGFIDDKRTETCYKLINLTNQLFVGLKCILYGKFFSNSQDVNNLKFTITNLSNSVNKITPILLKHNSNSFESIQSCKTFYKSLISDKVIDTIFDLVTP